MAQNLTLTLLASGLLLTACGGGGDGGAAGSTGPDTTTVTPVAVPTLGDPSGFPVGDAFANVRKQGFFESTTLKQQASPYLDVFQEDRQSIPVSTASGITASVTSSVMAGAANVFGQYLFAAVYTTTTQLAFDARFNVTSFVTDGQTYCESDGVPNFPEFIAGVESTVQSGTTTTYTCYANSTKARVVDIRKGSYRATLNSDDTLRYALTYRFLDAAGADNGLYRTATYVLSRSGRLTPQTVDAFGTYGATSTPSQFRGTYTGYRY
jgi:hypothetical protein